MWVMLFSGHSLITIKWDLEKHFIKIGKWLTPAIKNKKQAYSNSPLKL